MPNTATAPQVRENRAKFVADQLAAKRWSNRQAAMAIGISHTALGERVSGRVPFGADELERIATIVDRDPVEFYADYIAASTPRPGSGARRRNLYLIDGTETLGLETNSFGANTFHHIAPVTDIRARRRA